MGIRVPQLPFGRDSQRVWKTIGKEWYFLKLEPVDTLISLVREMTPFFMENNSEVTALDLLLEVD